ncbi:MAG: NifB/NifX family molybdenum-iron cluster-binding protein [bacterium]
MSSQEAGGTRIAIPASGEGEDRAPARRFGRCSHFAIFDSASESWTFLPNPARDQERGAGVAAAQSMVAEGVDVVIGPRLGPNAAGVLEEAAIAVVPLPGGEAATVSRVLDVWLRARTREI